MTNAANTFTGAFTGNGAGLTNMSVASLGSGTATSAVTFNNPASSFSGAFNGNGGGLTNLNASQLISGTVPDARLSNNVVNSISPLPLVCSNS